MANAMYDKGREGFLDGSIDWDTDTIKTVLLDAADYTPDLAAHDNLDDVPAGARVGTPQTLTGKTKTNGVADADDVTFPTVTGDPCEYQLIYKDTGVESTSRLIALIDTATGLPITPNGGDIITQWDNGANKIFKL
ncbi:MAG: bacteriophage protein [Planctomycetota bacterium]